MKDELDEKIAAGMRELARREDPILGLSHIRERFLLRAEQDMFRRDQIQEVRPLTKEPHHGR